MFKDYWIYGWTIAKQEAYHWLLCGIIKKFDKKGITKEITKKEEAEMTVARMMGDKGNNDEAIEKDMRQIQLENLKKEMSQIQLENLFKRE